MTGLSTTLIGFSDIQTAEICPTSLEGRDRDVIAAPGNQVR